MVFVLILTRVGGIVILAPVFGSSDLPVQFRALFAFALSILILPTQWDVQIGEARNLTAFSVLLAAELVIGLSLGMGIYIFFNGLGLAGELVGQIGGLTAAQIFDPISGDQSPILSRAFNYLGVVVFAAIGGLTVLLSAMLDTFETLPLGEGIVQVSIGYSLVQLVSLSFALAIRVAAPVLVSVLVVMLVMGLLSKSLPQLNIMSVGFGINSMVMFGVLSLSIGAGIWCFQERILDAFQILFDGLHAHVDMDWIS